MARYELHRISDADCTTVLSTVEASFDSAEQAESEASGYSGGAYGVAILDTATGVADFGAGIVRRAVITD